ncbi:MAG: GNAT family N-acetyltransferase [Leptolyngbyaceae cyanobacterium MO_188.B28]|nr:GNAT family N-acetyltransferase [Leptolyngbyaceae cyanobacterium MO_188.B28]
MQNHLTIHSTLQEFEQRGITVRPITSEDEDFLYTLYASSREEELSAVDWDLSFREEFLRMQFMAQHQYYHERFIDPEFLIILLQEKSIGRIYIDHRQHEIALAEITLLPEYRNQGIGSLFVQDLKTKAAARKLPLRLHVEHFNRARKLYDRLGFQQIEDTGVHSHMEWSSQLAL